MKKKVDEAVRQRIRGERMLLARKSPSEVAEAVKVSRQMAYAWKRVGQRASGRCWGHSHHERHLFEYRNRHRLTFGVHARTRSSLPGVGVLHW